MWCDSPNVLNRLLKALLAEAANEQSTLPSITGNKHITQQR